MLWLGRREGHRGDNGGCGGILGLNELLARGGQDGDAKCSITCSI